MKLAKAVLLIALILLNVCILQAQVKLTNESVSLPTYKVLPPEKAPVFFTKGKFQGASRYTYPLALNDQISGERQQQNWQFITLENEYIKLGITPEIGGKLYYATDKTNGHNFVYKNNEVKPGNIGMTGAWVSGGIEWCVLHHHRASTFLPMDYATRENPDGSKTVFIGETEPRHRMRWNVGITVYPGKSYFEADVNIYNPTPNTNSILYWANVAAHTNENFQAIFPPSVQLATYHSKTEFTHWPISTTTYRGTYYGPDGTDISWWKNVKKSASFFAHDLKENFMGGYDHGVEAGTVHIGDHNIVKGAKLWEWGSGPRGQATEGRLTETSGPYVEIMVGAFSDNQPDYSWIKPYETKHWKQYWYPVKDIGGFKNANLDAAVNLEKRENNKVFVGYYSTQKLKNAQVILKYKNKIILDEKVELSPEKTFTKEIKLVGDIDKTLLFTELIDLESGKQIISYQPKTFVQPDLPPEVKEPKKPEEIETTEELYLAGKRIEQFYNPLYNDMDYFNEVLRRDPGDIRTNTTLGRKALLNGNYTQAQKYLSTAITRLTRDYTRPKNCEPLYLQGLVLKALNLYDEAIDTLYRATWDYPFYSAAYFELAQISCKKGDFKKALDQINESLSTNTKNVRALALKATIERKLSDYKAAKNTLDGRLKTDPLDFRMANEDYLLAKETNNPEAVQKLNELKQRMRNFEQNYLEVAVSYINDGMLDEAENVLSRYEGEYPIISYYRGFIQDKKGNKTAAAGYFKTASELSEDYCFPFRLETVDVLKKALEYNPLDGKAYYYIGNIYYDKQSALAMQYFQKAVEATPGLAMAWRNLGWGYNRHSDDYEKAIECYEKAIELNGSEAIFYAELDKIYELNNSPIKKRLALFEGKNDVVKNRDDAFVQQTKVLTLAGQPAKALEYSEGKHFSYREGRSGVREMKIDAHLTLGLQFFNQKKYKEALDQFLLAQVPEEEAGSARLGNRNMQVFYFIAKAYEALNEKSSAREYLQKSAELNGEKVSLMNYYQGLSLAALKQDEKAREIFESLITAGNEKMSDNTVPDFFAIFGEKEAKGTRKSIAHTLIALGNKGLGNSTKAKEELQTAVALSVANLWASIELSQFNK